MLKKHGALLLEECSFYGLECLAQRIRGETCPLDLLLSDRRLREGEEQARDNPDQQKDVLIDVYGKAEFTYEKREALELPLLLTDVPAPVVFASRGDPLKEFYQRLNTFTGELLQELKGIQGIIVAGGAVTGALTGCAGACFPNLVRF